MKPRGKKLAFNKETVRTLTNSELSKALGGRETTAWFCTGESIICTSETGGCTDLCDTVVGCDTNTCY
jgi:hypothetical protein